MLLIAPWKVIAIKVIERLFHILNFLAYKTTTIKEKYKQLNKNCLKIPNWIIYIFIYYS